MPLILLILLLLLSGCTSMKRCGGITDDPTAYRQCIASNGDKMAQYEIGMEAFYAKDTKNALKWLKKAAMPIARNTPVYVPPVGGQKYGTIMHVTNIKASRGYGAAQMMLARIYEFGLGVEVDKKKAEKYRNMAGS